MALKKKWEGGSFLPLGEMYVLTKKFESIEENSLSSGSILDLCKLERLQVF